MNDVDRYRVNGALGFWQIAASDPDRCAVRDASGEATTYGALCADANRISRAMVAWGLAPDDVVAVMLPNHSVFLAVQFACLQSGIQMAPIDCHLTAPELAHILTDSDAKVFIAHHRYRRVATAAADLAGLGAPARIGTEPFDSFTGMAEWLAEQPPSPPAMRLCGQMFWYTSGSTGRPKGVRRAISDVTPEESLTQLIPAFAAFRGLPMGSVVHLAVLPLYHAGGNKQACFALHLGHTVVLMKSVTPEGVLGQIQQHRVNTTLVAPMIFRWWLDLPDDVRIGYDVSTLVHLLHGGAPCPMEVKRRIIEWLGPVVCESYGATEGHGTFVTAAEWLEHPGTVGRASPGSTIAVLGPDGERLPPGQQGLIYLKREGDSFWYHKQPDLLASRRRHDLFTVGDVGWLDEDGWLYLSGRESEVLNVAGRKVFPEEVEQTLLQHPAVKDVAVSGRAGTMGDVVIARVEAMAGVDERTLIAELMELCGRGLAAYKRPVVIECGPVSRSRTGKLTRQNDRDLGSAS
jgi:long-chain acyl-CoA synthetase